MTSGAQRKLDRRVVRTRKAIMDAFDRLLEVNALDKITVSAIAREADIDRKTFYLHYASVNDLADRKMADMLERIAGALKEKGVNGPSAESVHVVLMEVNSILTERLAMYEKVASTFSVEQILDRFGDVVQASLERMGVGAEFMEKPAQRMRFQFYLAGALSLYSTWLLSDHALPVEMVSDTIEEAVSSKVFPAMPASGGA